MVTGVKYCLIKCHGQILRTSKGAILHGKVTANIWPPIYGRFDFPNSIALLVMPRLLDSKIESKQKPDFSSLASLNLGLFDRFIPSISLILNLPLAVRLRRGSLGGGSSRLIFAYKTRQIVGSFRCLLDADLGIL